tara:strand:- start:8161 stop:8496 length:336 start_codon:yes stop_codon:yes gene_type:complete
MISIGRKLQKWIDDLRLLFLINKLRHNIKKNRFEISIAKNSSFEKYNEIGLLEITDDIYINFENFKKTYLLNSQKIHDKKSILLLYKIIQIQRKYINHKKENINPFNYEMY